MGRYAAKVFLPRDTATQLRPSHVHAHRNLWICQTWVPANLFGGWVGGVEECGGTGLGRNKPASCEQSVICPLLTWQMLGTACALQNALGGSSKAVSGAPHSYTRLLSVLSLLPQLWESSFPTSAAADPRFHRAPSLPTSQPTPGLAASAKLSPPTVRPDFPSRVSQSGSVFRVVLGCPRETTEPPW